MEITPLTGPNAIELLKRKMGKPEKKIVEKSEIKKAKLKIKRHISDHIEQTDDFIYLLTDYMKIQNEQLLRNISKYKGLSYEDTDKLIDKYLKATYYTPNITR